MDSGVLEQKGLLVFNYARVSTQGKNQDVASQLTYLHEIETQKGWKWLDYSDEKSGKADLVKHRDGLRKMFVDLQGTYYDPAGVCVFAGDRLARSVKLGLTIAEKIKNLDKFLWIPQKGLFMDKDHWGQGELGMFMMEFYVGEAGNMQHAQDVKRGINQKWVSVKPDGTKVSHWNEWKRSPFDLENAKKLRASGYSYGEIANMLGASNPQFVYRRLKKGI